MVERFVQIAEEIFFVLIVVPDAVLRRSLHPESIVMYMQTDKEIIITTLGKGRPCCYILE